MYALQTFRIINTASRPTLEGILAVFCRKYVKPEMQPTAKHKWHRLVFDPNTMKLPDFLEGINQGAEQPFGENAQELTDSLFYAKLPPNQERSVNMTRLENATYEEVVAHLERELELNGLEESDDIPVPTISTAPIATRPEEEFFPLASTQGLFATIAKNQVIPKTFAVSSKGKKNKNATTARIPENIIQSARLLKTNTRRKGVGKALEPTSNLKTSKKRILKLTSTSHNDATNKQTTSILKNPKKTRFATTPNK